MYPDYEVNFQNSSGLRLPTIDEYSYFLNNQNCPDDLFINNGGAISNDPDCFVAVQTDKNHFKLVPGPEFSPRLYRGQSRFYDPCYPSIFRSRSRIERMADAIRKEEFILLVKEHPISKDLERIKIKNLYLQIDFEGLAQHYGFRTNYLDASRSRDIAMFFATSTYNAKKNIYEPIVTENHIGVIYTVDLFQGLVSRTKKVNVIGLQAQPRPGAQKSFSIRLTGNDNFNSMTYVKYEKFEITREVAEHYFHKFNCGKDLFPKDMMDYKAKYIQNCGSLSEDAFIRYCQKKGVKSKRDEKMKKRELLGAGIQFREHDIKFTRNELLSINDAWAQTRPNFINKIKARFVAEPYENL